MPTDGRTLETQTLEELGSRACILATFGRHREAIETINTALKKYPNDERLLNNRCCSYIQMRNFEKAFADAEYLTKHFPNFVKGYLRKAEVFTLLKKYAEAEKVYRKALDLEENEDVHLRFLQVQLLQIMGSGFDPYSSWQALCETGSIQQSLRLLKTPYRNYEHVMNASFLGDAFFKRIEEGSTLSEEDLECGLGSLQSQPELVEKFDIKIKEGVKTEEKSFKEKKQKENLFGGKRIRKKFPNKQDKTKKIIRRNKKKLLFVKSEEKTENVLAVRNK